MARCFGVEQVAHAAADEICQVAIVGEVGRHALALPGDVEHHQGEHLVGRAGEIELELAVLVDGAHGANRRGALAVLAQALGPELAEPQTEKGEAVDIGHQHRGADAAALVERDGRRRAQRRRRLARCRGTEGRVEHRRRALAQRRRASSPAINAGSSPTFDSTV